MPVYTFKCEKCHKTFDEFVHSHDVSEMKCKCNSESTAIRIFSVPAKPKFNGAGFYETDYKQK